MVPVGMVVAAESGLGGELVSIQMIVATAAIL